MELELGLKITRTREDVSSSSVEFHFSKDPFGPLVLSQETDSRFIIIIHLKGFKKEGIEIDINEEGNRITIQGRKPVEEMVMIRWMAWRKEVEFRFFKKVFRIPDTVILDEIKARFDDDDATLTITMPKRVKGITGFNIEDLEEGEESQVLEEEQEDEEGTEDDYLEKSHQIDEQDKILERIEEEKELADSDKDREDSSLRKPSDIEGRDSHEQTRHDKQDKRHQLVEAESISDEFGSTAFEDIKEQEPDSESGAKEKKTTDDDGDGMSKDQGIKERERRNDEHKIQDIVQGKGGEDKKKNVKTETKKQDRKEDVEARMGEGFIPNIDATQVNGEVDIKEHEKIRELVEDKTPKAETDVRTNIPKTVKEIKVPDQVDTLGKIGDEGKEGKEKLNIVKKEIENRDAKEKIDVFASNIADTAMQYKDFESDKLESDKEVDKIKELTEKKDKQEENAEAGTQSEDISLTKLQETEEQRFQGQKRHDKQEDIKELVDEQTPEAERNIGNDKPKPIQERCEGKHKIRKLLQEETKNQQEEYKEKNKETGKKTNDAVIRKVQELTEPTRSEKESKTRELVKNKRNDEEKEEKEIAATETKVQESNRQKMLREQEKIQEVAEENTNFSKHGKAKEEEEIAEKKTEFGDDDEISRKVRDSDARKGQEDKDMIQELVLEEKVSDGGKGITAVSEEKAENDKSKKVLETDEQQSHEEDTSRKQSQERLVGEAEDVKKAEEEKGIRDCKRKGQETEKTDSDVSRECIKGTTIQELDDNREIYRNEHEEEKKYDRPEKITGRIEQELVTLNNQLEQDNVENGEKTEEPREEENKDCKEEEGSEESKIKTDDGVERKVQGIKKEEFHEPKREHISKIKELLEEKTGGHEKEEEKELAESNIKAECSCLRKVDGSEEQKLHEPKIDKERDKTRITGAEKEEEKTVESTTIGDNENSTNVKEIMEERHENPERHEKGFKIDEVVEAGHDNHKEEKVMANTELETEEESSKKIQKIEQQEYDGLKRSMVQEMMQETGEKQKTKAVEEKENLEKRKKPKDCSLRKVQDDEDLELSKSYKKQREGMVHSSDYREKVKKKDEDDEQSNITQLEEGGKVENIAELGENMEDDTSGKFYESEEGKSYEDWTHEEQEKRKHLVKGEATGPKDKQTGGDGHNEEQQDVKVTAKAELKLEEDSSKKVQEIEKQEYDKLRRSIVQENMQETEEREKTRAMEVNDIVERRKKSRDGNLRKVQEGEGPESSRHKRHGEEDRIQELMETEISDHREKVKKKDILRSQETGTVDLSELERHWEERKNHQSVEDEKGEGTMEKISEPGGKMAGDSSGKFHEETEKLVREEATDLNVKHIGGEHEEEEIYEKVADTKTKVEDETNKKVGENKDVDSDKHERIGKLDKLVLREGESDREKEEENLLDDVMTEIQQNENEEVHELKMDEKLDRVQDFMEDETGDQEDKEAEEAAAVVASNETESSKNVQTIKEEEDEDKEQNKIAETKEEVPKTRSVQETKEIEAHVQELEGKTENCRDHDGEGRRGEKGKQGKTVETTSRERFETKSEDGNEGKIQETKLQESNKGLSIHEVKLVTENDSLRKGQEFAEKDSNMSNKGPVKQEKIQQPKKVETQDRVNEDEEQAEAETKVNDCKSSMNGEQKRIRKPMEEKSNAPEKEAEENERIAEEQMQDKIDSIKDKKIKGQEPYELLKHEDVDKIPEYHREEEKGIKQREIEDMEKKANDVNLRKVQQINDELEKHREPSEIPKNQVEQAPQKHREDELNERGGYKEVLQAKSMASRESQDVEEKGPNQQELIIEDRKEEYHRIEGEQKEMAKRLLQVESKANDDSSENNETEVHESTELREPKKKENHQELVDIETRDQRKEERKEEKVVGKERKEEKVVGKAKTIDEYDSSRKIHRLEEEQKSDKMSEKPSEEETSDDDKESKEGHKSGAVCREGETKIKDDVFEKVKQIKEQEKYKRQSYVEMDTSGKAKDNNNQETKRRYDSSGNENQEDEKQVSHEQSRHEEEVVPTKFGKVRETENKEQGKKQSYVEKDTGEKAKENKKKSKDKSSRKTQENEKPESHEQKKNEEQDEKNHSEHKEIAEAEVPRKLKRTEKQESTKMAERHENRGSVKELVEENNKQGEEKSMISEVVRKAEDDEWKGTKGLIKEDKKSELTLRDILKDDKTTKTETKGKDNESRKIHEVKEEVSNEQERLKEQGIVKELVEDRTLYCREEDGSSKKIQDRDKEESNEPGRADKQDKIQEPVDRETSEDNEEELEIEFEDEEEDWEAEVIQKTDSDEDTDDIRKIKRIRLGFRLVGGSTIFMSLIVIVISFIRSKRKIRCYKF